MKKKFRILSIAAALIVAGFSVYSCWEIKNIVVPASVKANSEFEVTVNTYMHPQESDYTTKLVVMVCVPKSWNAQSTASATFSTTGYVSAMAQKDLAVEEIVNEKMVPLTGTEIEPTTGLPYAQAMAKTYFDGGNFGEVEWIGFVSEKEHTVTDISACATLGFDLAVKLKFKTDDVNYKFFINAWAGGLMRGMGRNDFGGDPQCTQVATEVVTVTGGSSKADYTVPAMVSTIPTEFRFGDFFCVNLMTNLEGAESALDGVDEVYLCGKAVFADGSEKVVEGPIAKNLMEKKNDHFYSKYILPCMFFDAPYDQKITGLYVWFTDKTGTIVERCMSEIGWEFSQANNE